MGFAGRHSPVASDRIRPDECEPPTDGRRPEAGVAVVVDAKIAERD